jgi:hypothetical protein
MYVANFTGILSKIIHNSRAKSQTLISIRQEAGGSVSTTLNNQAEGSVSTTLNNQAGGSFMGVLNLYLLSKSVRF